MINSRRQKGQCSVPCFWQSHTSTGIYTNLVWSLHMCAWMSKAFTFFKPLLLQYCVIIRTEEIQLPSHKTLFRCQKASCVSTEIYIHIQYTIFLLLLIFYFIHFHWMMITKRVHTFWSVNRNDGIVQKNCELQLLESTWS